MDATRRGAKKASPEYARVFTALAAGAYLFVTGIIGFDVRYLHGLFRGGRWVDPPIWWQIGVGIGLLVLAAFLIRRLPYRWAMVLEPRRRVVNVGSGKSRGARRGSVGMRAIDAAQPTDRGDE